MSDDAATPSPTGSVIAPVLLADRMGCFMLLLLRLESCSVVPMDSGDVSSWERPGKIRDARIAKRLRCVARTRLGAGRVNQEEGRRRLRHDMRGILRRLGARGLLHCNSPCGRQGYTPHFARILSIVPLARSLASEALIWLSSSASLFRTAIPALPASLGS